MSPAARWPARHGDDRGSATVLLLGWLMVLAMSAGILLAISAVSLARRQAATGADLAALAAASDRTGDPATACGRARVFAARNGAELVACRTTGDAVEVVTRVHPPPALRLLGPLAATSRAGPWIGVTSRAETGAGG
ncbi:MULTISPECIES: Rv3654c family TadE-like protein [Pseudofrankia]|uniref:Rv3654c family TadE-like protein n=1 Tax=Pseudofrankia TaxID=2994363 RepID=UPI000234CE65|nr:MULTISPECIES: Rv3654c family TadE-like protein [Pseudofrankia]OHV32981.1 helicase [Pseudofrankia sp. EUN1h]